jgi:hypothetical protein
MTGYSGTPLWKKLGIRTGFRIHLHNPPQGWSIPDSPEGVEWLGNEDESTVDIIVAFFHDAAAYGAELSHLGERIHPGGSLWIAWPRKAAGHVSDLGDVIIRDTALEMGLVDTKVAALDEDWSGLKFVWRLERRGA